MPPTCSCPLGGLFRHLHDGHMHPLRSQHLALLLLSHTTEFGLCCHSAESLWAENPKPHGLLTLLSEWVHMSPKEQAVCSEVAVLTNEHNEVQMADRLLHSTRESELCYL